MGKGWEQTFLGKRYTNSQQDTKESSASLTARKTQVKTMARDNLTPIRMATVKKEKRETTQQTPVRKQVGTLGWGWG